MILTAFFERFLFLLLSFQAKAFEGLSRCVLLKIQTNNKKTEI